MICFEACDQGRPGLLCRDFFLFFLFLGWVGKVCGKGLGVILWLPRHEKPADGGDWASGRWRFQLELINFPKGRKLFGCAAERLMRYERYWTDHGWRTKQQAARAADDGGLFLRITGLGMIEIGMGRLLQVI